MTHSTNLICGVTFARNDNSNRPRLQFFILCEIRHIDPINNMIAPTRYTYRIHNWG